MLEKVVNRQLFTMKFNSSRLKKFGYDIEIDYNKALSDKDIKYNLKHIDLTAWSLPLYAKKHNPIITKEMIEDPKVMYTIDYIGIYPKQ